MASLSSSAEAGRQCQLMHMKKAKRAAESEAKLLANRLQLLIKEEAKALRMIESSKKKMEQMAKMREVSFACVPALGAMQ
jgi:hypothetical protein